MKISLALLWAILLCAGFGSYARAAVSVSFSFAVLKASHPLASIR